MKMMNNNNNNTVIIKLSAISIFNKYITEQAGKLIQDWWNNGKMIMIMGGASNSAGFWLNWREILVEVVREWVKLLASCIRLEWPESLPPMPASVSLGRTIPMKEGAVQEVGNHSCHCRWRWEYHIHDVVKLQRWVVSVHIATKWTHYFDKRKKKDPSALVDFGPDH